MQKKKLSLPIIIFLVLLILLSAVISIYLASANQSYRNLDFFTFWLGGRMAGSGQDVYNQSLWVGNHTLFGSTWIENPYYVYPLSTAILAIPFGMMDIRIASVIWLFLSMLAIIAGVLLMLALWQKANWQAYIVLFIFGTFLFRPTFLCLSNGQIDGFLFCLMAGALYLFSHNKRGIACFLLALLLLKPNIGGPIIALLLLYAALGILLLPLFFDPDWIGKYILVGLHKSADNNLFPNLRGLAGLIVHESPMWTIVVWGLLGLSIIVGLIFVYLKLRQKFDWSTVLVVAIPVTLLVTPYLRAYDLMLLLIPILEITRHLVERGTSFLKVNLAYLGWSLLAFALLFLAVALNHDILSVGLSVLVLVLLGIQLHESPRSLTIPLS
jgi:hypothetical protein